MTLRHFRYGGALLIASALLFAIGGGAGMAWIGWSVWSGPIREPA